MTRLTYFVHATVSLYILTIHRCTCSIDKLPCFRTILNHFYDLYDCPWDITVSCSAPNFICYKNDSLCDLEHLPTNISMIVFWLNIPILRDERAPIGVGSNCKCKEVLFSCYITMDNNTNLEDHCGDKNLMSSTSPAVTAMKTEDSKSVSCPDEGEYSVKDIIGAFFGGSVLVVLVTAISFLATKKYRNIKVVAETALNTAHRTFSYNNDRDKQSRSIDSYHIYNTITDSTARVSHVRPMVRLEIGTEVGTPCEPVKSISTTYSHLNALDYNKNGNSHDYAMPIKRVAHASKKDDDVVTNSGVNDYTEVVGEGFRNSSEIKHIANLPTESNINVMSKTSNVKDA